MDGDKVKVIVKNPGFYNLHSTTLSPNANSRNWKTLRKKSLANHHIHSEETTSDIELFKIIRGSGEARKI